MLRSQQTSVLLRILMTPKYVMRIILLCPIILGVATQPSSRRCVSDGLELQAAVEASPLNGTTIILCGNLNLTEVFPIDLSNKKINLLCGKPRTGKKENRRCILNGQGRKAFFGNSTHFSVNGVNFVGSGNKGYPGTFEASSGGALYFTHSTIILRECSFIGNRASDGGAITLSGGNSELILQGGTKFNPMVFQSNNAFSAGAINLQGKRLVIRPYTQFIGNSACEAKQEEGPGWGGTIAASVLRLNIKGVLFQSNSCVENGLNRAGGGAFLGNARTAIIDNCVFDNNAAGTGGALYGSFTNITVSRTNVTRNSAGGRAGTAGLHISTAYASFNDVFFHNNKLFRPPSPFRVIQAAGLEITFSKSIYFNNTVFNEFEDERLIAYGDATKVITENSYMCFGSADSQIGNITDEVYIRDHYFGDNASSVPLCNVP